MKFELFGRLRDNDDNAPDTGGSAGADNGLGGGSPGMGEQGNEPQIGGGLEENVERMFNQGYSEEEIRQELEGQYSQTEIDQAVNRTITSSATGGNQGGPEPMTPYNGGDESVSPMDEGYDQDGGQENPPPQENQPMDQSGGMGGQGSQQQASPSSQGPPPLQQQGSGGQQSSGNSNVEELVETIVAENLQKVENEFENAYSEIDEIKNRLDDLEERVEELEIRDDEDQTQFIQKIDELEEDIDSYQARMGGLEKAFQQILPSLVDNVRDLTSLVQEIKQERGIETEANVNEEDIDDIDMEDW